MKVVGGSCILHGLNQRQLIQLEAEHMRPRPPENQDAKQIEWVCAEFVRCLQDAFPRQDDLFVANRSRQGFSWADHSK